MDQNRKRTGGRVLCLENASQNYGKPAYSLRLTGGGGKVEFNSSPVPYLQGGKDVVCRFQRGDHPRGCDSHRDLMILFSQFLHPPNVRTGM